MTVRLFDGVDDRITTALGALGFAFGPGTVALLQKANADAVLWTPLEVGSVSTARYGLRRNASNQSQLRLNGNATTGPAGTGIVVSDGWIIGAITKATGTVAPRFHQLRFSDGAISHVSATTTVANSSAPTARAQIGMAFSSVEFFNGLIGVAAFWNVVLSDAQIEELWTNRRTSDWWNNSAGRPLALWEFAQASAATAVTDLTGNGADQTAITGTTVVTTDDPPSWTFNGVGGGISSYSATAAVSFSIADASTRAAISRARVSSDAVSISDASIRAAASRARASSDTVAVADSSVGALGPSSKVRVSGDALSISDASTRAALARVRTAGDALPRGDSATRATATRARSGSDAIPRTDSASRAVVSRVRSAGDATSFADAATKPTDPVAYARSVADGLTIFDTAARAVSRARSAADALSVGDASLLAASARVRAAADTFSVVDEGSAALTFARSAFVIWTIESGVVAIVTVAPPPPPPLPPLGRLLPWRCPVDGGRMFEEGTPDNVFRPPTVSGSIMVRPGRMHSRCESCGFRIEQMIG